MKKLNLKTGMWLLAISLGLMSCDKKNVSPACNGNSGSEAGIMSAAKAGPASIAIPTLSPATDYITGGGSLDVGGRKKATFAISGGLKKGNFWGDLQFNDHNVGGPKVNGLTVTNYVVLSPTSRTIMGTCKINGSPGYTYTVDVTDNGESGSNDVFGIFLSTGYSTLDTIEGGNIQLNPL